MEWVKLPFGTREQRAAFNEALCRQLNERKAEALRLYGQPAPRRERADAVPAMR